MVDRYGYPKLSSLLVSVSSEDHTVLESRIKLGKPFYWTKGETRITVSKGAKYWRAYRYLEGANFFQHVGKGSLITPKLLDQVAVSLSAEQLALRTFAPPVQRDGRSKQMLKSELTILIEENQRLRATCSDLRQRLELLQGKVYIS